MKIERLTCEQEGEVIQSAWAINLEKERVKEGYFFLPENHVEIMIVLKGSLSRRIVGYRKAHTFTQGEMVISRARNRGMVIESEEQVSFLLLKVRPLYLSIFQQNPYYNSKEEIQKLTMPAKFSYKWRTAIFQRDACKLVMMLSGYTRELLETTKLTIDPVIESTIEKIQEQRGEIKIKEINEMLGICKSTLEQRFSREVGITPKEFCKIEKLGYFLKNYAENHDRMTLTQLTFMSGYYDQSHLIKDFKYYVEESPKRFLNQTNKVLLVV